MKKKIYPSDLFFIEACELELMKYNFFRNKDLNDKKHGQIEEKDGI